MNFRTHDNRDRRSAEQSVSFNVPSCLLQNGVARCGKSGEVGHRRSGHYRAARLCRQPEQVDYPSERNLFERD